MNSPYCRVVVIAVIAISSIMHNRITHYERYHLYLYHQCLCCRNRCYYYISNSRLHAHLLEVTTVTND